MNLIQEINELGITIQLVDADHVALTPKEKLSPELIEKVRANKRELLRTLQDTHDKGDTEIVAPRGDTVPVFSKMLNRNILLQWSGDATGGVFVDGVLYTLSEIEKLKEMPLTPEDLRTIHRVKREFEGEITE